jgi:hypothetical protein
MHQQGAAIFRSGLMIAAIRYAPFSPSCPQTTAVFGGLKKHHCRLTAASAAGGARPLRSRRTRCSRLQRCQTAPRRPRWARSVTNGGKDVHSHSDCVDDLPAFTLIAAPRVPQGMRGWRGNRRCKQARSLVAQRRGTCGSCSRLLGMDFILRDTLRFLVRSFSCVLVCGFQKLHNIKYIHVIYLGFTSCHPSTHCHTA